CIIQPALPSAFSSLLFPHLLSLWHNPIPFQVAFPLVLKSVVGALFAAFLVMLLIYRMKKKDEGSYTLEEPKQATVTYQKPDKQEEFYA
uniref:Syndecan n=1 Tax=Neogobius melanostomus TaxID=47308 RepID=A0A8C6T5G3_9GOBI